MACRRQVRVNHGFESHTPAVRGDASQECGVRALNGSGRDLGDLSGAMVILADGNRIEVGTAQPRNERGPPGPSEHGGIWPGTAWSLPSRGITGDQGRATYSSREDAGAEVGTGERQTTPATEYAGTGKRHFGLPAAWIACSGGSLVQIQLAPPSPNRLVWHSGTTRFRQDAGKDSRSAPAELGDGPIDVGRGVKPVSRQRWQGDACPRRGSSSEERC